MAKLTYRGYCISQKWETAPPQPDQFEFVHPDYDGPPDRRCGCGVNLKDVCEKIDELVREEITKRLADDVPADIAAFAVEFCLVYEISGTSDPMYVANIAALEMNRGDGHGWFLAGTGNTSADPALTLYDRLRRSYAVCIARSGARVELLGELVGELTRRDVGSEARQPAVKGEPSAHS